MCLLNARLLKVNGDSSKVNEHSSKSKVVISDSDDADDEEAPDVTVETKLKPSIPLNDTDKSSKKVRQTSDQSDTVEEMETNRSEVLYSMFYSSCSNFTMIFPFILQPSALDKTSPCFNGSDSEFFQSANLSETTSDKLTPKKKQQYFKTLFALLQ